MQLELLDPSDDAARIAYERAFYLSFAPVAHSRLLRTLWLWDDAGQRLATRLPYGDQRIYLWRHGGSIDGALAVNVRMTQFQSAAYGFAPPAASDGTCEMLAFFVVTARDMKASAGFWRRCLVDLHAMGFRDAYATARPDTYPTYRRYGAEQLAEVEIEGERRYFIRFATASALPFIGGAEERRVTGPIAASA